MSGKFADLFLTDLGYNRDKNNSADQEKLMNKFVTCLLTVILFVFSAQTVAVSAVGPAAKKDFFPEPFNEKSALELVFAPENSKGDVVWQASRELMDVAGVNPGEKPVLTVSAGFMSYDLSEKETRTLIVFESRVAPQDSEEGYVPVVGAALFASDGKICRLIWAEKALLQFGNDMEPLSVRFEKIGKGLGGAILEAGSTNQGYTVTRAVVLAEYQNTVVVAARDLQIYEDNEGAAETESQRFQYEARIEFIPGAHEQYFNMRLNYEGTAANEISGGDLPVGAVVPANYAVNYFWDEGIYEQEIECGN